MLWRSNWSATCLQWAALRGSSISPQRAQKCSQGWPKSSRLGQPRASPGRSCGLLALDWGSLRLSEPADGRSPFLYHSNQSSKKFLRWLKLDGLWEPMIARFQDLIWVLAWHTVHACRISEKVHRNCVLTKSHQNQRLEKFHPSMNWGMIHHIWHSVIWIGSFVIWFGVVS